MRLINWATPVDVNILIVGIATIDIISDVHRYPQEDEELRAHAMRMVRGGNGTNMLVVLSQLRHQGMWAGTLADDRFATLIRQDLMQYGIDLSPVIQHVDTTTPVSCITNSQKNGTRTIVHYRQLPEYDANHFLRLPISHCDWIHFEGRNVAETIEMLRAVASAGIMCSLEIEKDRADIERLIPLAQIVLFSKHYVHTQGFESAEDFLLTYQIRYPRTVMVCAWGAEGAYAVAPNQTILHCPANALEVIDSVGAGDVFNAGFIHRYQQSTDVNSALVFACRLAERKCRQQGFSDLEWQDIIKL